MIAGMKGVAGILVSVLAKDENGPTLVSYWHAETDETLEAIPGLFKSKMHIKDPMGGQTTYQDIPTFRIADLPWNETTLSGDVITDAAGAAWEVTFGNTSPMGVTTVNVFEVKPKVTI